MAQPLPHNYTIAQPLPHNYTIAQKHLWTKQYNLFISVT